VTSGKEVILQIEMREKVYTTDVIEIIFERDKTQANNELVTSSARNFQSEETNRYAGSRGDPSKMVTNFAGVASGNDARNDIIVRGNSPLGVLWRLEGIDIPNPNHFSAQGATGGPISMLNNNLLANSDFLTGAFPAEYGNKMAAVFDLKLRNGNNEKMEYTGQIGINGLEIGVEGPISKSGGSFLANYRYSTLDLFDLLGINFGVSGIPRYQDLSFKVNIPTKSAGILSVWGIGGKSRIELLDSEKDSSDWSFTSSNEDLVFGSEMGATGLSHLYFFNSKTSGKLSISTSKSRFIVRVDTLNNAKEKFNTFKNKSDDGQNHFNYTLTHKRNSKNLFKTGVTYTLLDFDYNSFYYSRSESKNIYLLQEKGDAGIIQSYLHWQFRLNDKVTFNNGLHYQNFLLNNSQAIEPRIGVRWQLLPKHAFSAAYGLHSQHQPLLYYFYKTYNQSTGESIKTNSDLSLSKSQHYVLSYDYSINKDLRLKAETYYQYLFNIPVEKYKTSSFSMINVGNELEGLPLIDSLDNQGTGNNKGFEFTIEKFFSKNFYFLISTTLYESKYKGSDKIERQSAYSGGYIFNVLGGVEIPLGKPNKILAFDTKATWAAGNRYTPIDFEASEIEQRAVYVYNDAFSKKYKDYYKIDLKVSYKINQKRATQSWFINVENVTNRKNILRQVYDNSNQQMVTEYQLGLFPYGGYRIEF